jgi:hypothetical protein
MSLPSKKERETPRSAPYSLPIEMSTITPFLSNSKGSSKPVLLGESTVNLYFQLQKTLKRERPAMEQLRRFAGFSARLHTTANGGFAVLIPVGRRPEIVLKRLEQFCTYEPESFELVALNDEGTISALPVTDSTAV